MFSEDKLINDISGVKIIKKDPPKPDHTIKFENLKYGTETQQLAIVRSVDGSAAIEASDLLRKDFSHDSEENS